MEAKAVQRHVGIPATKVRLVIDQIRGKSVEEALAILQYAPQRSAPIIEKTLRSAVANAINLDDENPVDVDGLLVAKVFADEGRTLKRLKPRARGAASRIFKRQSHLTIIVSDGRADVAERVDSEVVDEGDEQPAEVEA